MFVFSGAVFASAAQTNPEQSKNNDSASANISKAVETDNVFGGSGFEIKVDKISDNSATLSWNSKGLLIRYRVCKFDSLTGKWEEYAETDENLIDIKNLSANTGYMFCVFNSATNDPLGVQAFKTAIKKPALKVKEKSSNMIVLSLGEHSKKETVVIYRKTAGKKFKKLAEVKGKSTYKDKDLKGNTTYYYKAKVITTKKGKKLESKFSKTIKAKTALKMGLPSVSGKTKTFAYYTAVTARSSPQYKLLNSKECTTDEETGIRMYDGCYCVALGSYYGTKIGTKYRITFSNGNSINVILCDQKANRHTDSKHQYAVNNKDIVEFYVQKSMMPRAIRGRGNYGVLPQFSGSVVSIEKYMD